jgi:hypothetical protein
MLSVYPLSVNKTLMQENILKKNNAREYENKSNFFRIHDAIFKQNSILKHIRKKNHILVQLDKNVKDLLPFTT